MYVCVYVCDSATAQTDGWISMKFSTNDLSDIYFREKNDLRPLMNFF